MTIELFNCAGGWLLAQKTKDIIEKRCLTSWSQLVGQKVIRAEVRGQEWDVTIWWVMESGKRVFFSLPRMCDSPLSHNQERTMFHLGHTFTDKKIMAWNHYEGGGIICESLTTDDGIVVSLGSARLCPGTTENFISAGVIVRDKMEEKAFPEAPEMYGHPLYHRASKAVRDELRAAWDKEDKADEARAKETVDKTKVQSEGE